MNEKLRKAYQRLEAKRLALDAINGTRTRYSKRFMERHYYFSDKAAPVEHLRKVGNVSSVAERYGESFTEGHTGWYCEPDNTVYKDGTGLCWGEVWQLPARKGKCRFIAGYRFGGIDGGPSMDFKRIFEDAVATDDDLKNKPACRDAARYADGMAELAAEEEREENQRYREEQEKYEDA